MKYTSSLTAEDIMQLASHNQLEITPEKLYEVLTQVEELGSMKGEHETMDSYERSPWRNAE